MRIVRRGDPDYDKDLIDSPPSTRFNSWKAIKLRNLLRQTA
jgi:hypothetical protein